MSDKSRMQQKHLQGRNEQEYTQWGGIEPSPMRLTPVRPRQTQRSTEYDEQLDDETLYPTRQSSSTRRYQTNSVPQKGHAHVEREVRQGDLYGDVNVHIRHKHSHQSVPPRQQYAQSPTEHFLKKHDDEEPESKRLSRLHRCVHRLHFSWHWTLGIGMLVMLLLWIGGSLLMNWWQGYQEDVQYGHPRTYQTDARVGHNDTQVPSHFIALNVNRQVDVVEFPGGDAMKAKVYIGPTLLGQNSNRDIVTISFKDVNGDGKADMILRVANANYVYINDNGAFRPLHADEHINL